MSPRPPGRRTALLAAGALMAVPLLSGCQLASLTVRTGVLSAGSAARIHISPAPRPGATLAPGAPVVVSVADGRLTGVSVTGPTGALAGTLSPDGRTWTMDSSTLDFGSHYEVSARA